MLTASYSSQDWAPQNKIGNLAIYLVFPEISQTIKKWVLTKEVFQKGILNIQNWGLLFYPIV